VEQDALHAELMAVDDVSQADSAVSRIANFEVEDGRAGIAR
jgi:hypothetical protein